MEGRSTRGVNRVFACVAFSLLACLPVLAGPVCPKGASCCPEEACAHCPIAELVRTCWREWTNWSTATTMKEDGPACYECEAELELVFADDILCGRRSPQLLLEGNVGILIVPPRAGGALTVSVNADPFLFADAADVAPTREPRRLPDLPVNGAKQCANCPASPNHESCEANRIAEVVARAAEEEEVEVLTTALKRATPATASPVPHTTAKPTTEPAPAKSEAWLVSCHFDGAQLEDVVKYFRHATGCSFTVDPTAMTHSTVPDGVYVRCRNQPVEAALQTVLGSVGLGYSFRDRKFCIAPPAVIKAQAAEAKAQDQFWVPAHR